MQQSQAWNFGGSAAIARPDASAAQALLQGLRMLAAFGFFACVVVGAKHAASSKRPKTAPTFSRVAGYAPRMERWTTPEAKPRATKTDEMLDVDFFPDEAAATWARRIPGDNPDARPAEASDSNELLRFGPVKVRRQLVETIVSAARQTGVDPALLMAIADKESSFSTDVGTRTSSAIGLFQFIDTTWLRAVRKFGERHGLAREAAEIEGPAERPYVANPVRRAYILGLRASPTLSASLAADLLKDNGARIGDEIGRDLTSGEAYLTHFLGLSDATLFLSAVDDKPRSSAANLLPRPARANRSIFFTRGRSRALSVANVHEKIEKMINERVDRYAHVKDIPSVSAYTD